MLTLFCFSKERNIVSTVFFKVPRIIFKVEPSFANFLSTTLYATGTAPPWNNPFRTGSSCPRIIFCGSSFWQNSTIPSRTDSRIISSGLSLIFFVAEISLSPFSRSFALKTIRASYTIASVSCSEAFFSSSSQMFITA